jgi:hypothetical protein
MMEDFTKASNGLLTVTQREVEEFELGHYGKIFASPSQRLASLLAVEREIAVVFTTFEELQFRTISALKSFIEREAGRIEATVAIIIHCDPSGNLKLKRWGRDVDISILPIFFDQALPIGIEFERALCRELFSHDPFDVTGPVSDDAQFYGRRSEAQDLARQLQKGQIRCCLGIRKCGKTSMLNRVLQTVRSSHDCYSVMVDCSKDVISSQSAAQLLKSLATAIQTARTCVERYAIVGDYDPSSTISGGSTALLTELQQCSLPVVVFIDEVDYITPGSPTNDQWKEEFNPFWRNLRAAYQEAARQNKRLSILIGGVSSKWFSVESINGVENAALAFVPQEYLSPLPRGASIPMIKSIARTCGLQFDEENAVPIAFACSDIPFWIRKAGSFIHRNIDFHNRPLRPDKGVIEALLEKFIEVEGIPLAQVALGHLFRVYPELEQGASLALLGKTNSISKTLLYQLERYGILTSRQAGIELSGTLMRRALEAHISDHMVDPGSSAVPTNARTSLAFASTDEWAEELALVGKRRNLVERKLRDIVLNFIRFDSLQNKQKASALDRTIACLPQERRSKLQSASAEVAISKFLWTDLISLIDREWALFEKIFSNKKLFTDNAVLINDRFDAHAKSVDHADLALYRRALKWFEDALSAL